MLASDPAIILRSAAGTIIGWNDSAERMFGYRRGEVIGQPIALLDGAATHHSEPLAERTWITKGGRALRVLSRRTAISDGADQLLAICEVVTLLDSPAVELEPEPGVRSEVSPTYASLIAERDRLLSVVESSPGVVLSFRMSAEGQAGFTFVSAAAEELLGFTPAQIRADTALLRSRVPREDLARANASQREAARSGAPWNLEARYTHPSGQIKSLEGRFRPVRDSDGAISWNGVLLDVTSRKQAETNVALLQAQLDSALAATGMGSWILDLESGKVRANENLRVLWEVPPETPEWYEISDARSRVHPEDNERLFVQVNDIVASGGLLNSEFRMIRSDGSIRWLSTRARAQVEDGRPRRVVGVEVDITQQKLAAESALRSSKLEALGTLAGGVAHDFNNVLFAITGNAALALGALPVANEARNYVKEIASAAGRATELVRKILAFSRPEEQERVVVDVGALVHDALSLVRATTPAMVEIASSFDARTPPIVASASQLEQIVVNLCTNAVHAIGRGRPGHIEVRVEPLPVSDEAAADSGVPAGSYVVLSVSDDGCGMDEHTKSRIFDPFFTTKRTGEATGLGLSVVHGLMQALGGHVSVASQPDVGTTFRLYFPVAADFKADPNGAAQRPAEAQAKGLGQRILFVDDEAMLVALAESMLEVLGYEAAAFQDASKALAAFREAPQSFAAAITDLSMPGMSGFDLARSLLTIRRDLPILVMSGYVGADERKLAEQLGVRQLVLKPVTMERLRELVKELTST